jgi:hypothetical protein
MTRAYPEWKESRLRARPPTGQQEDKGDTHCGCRQRGQKGDKGDMGSQSLALPIEGAGTLARLAAGLTANHYT